MLAEDQIQEKIAQIEKQKQELIMNANNQASYLQGQIDALNALLVPVKEEKVENLK